VAVDPYYLFGSPSWRGINEVRPYYEPYDVVIKPYQLWRARPEAVVLGASSSEVALDPKHPGWGSTTAFNFSLPSSISYVTMLSFLHAQKIGAKQAVISLDFFAFNINFSVGIDERRFGTDGIEDFVRYLDETLPSRPKVLRAPPAPQREWNETIYLALN